MNKQEQMNLFRMVAPLTAVAISFGLGVSINAEAAIGFWFGVIWMTIAVNMALDIRDS